MKAKIAAGINAPSESISGILVDKMNGKNILWRICQLVPAIKNKAADQQARKLFHTGI